jgi:HEAT repeat protein
MRPTYIVLAAALAAAALPGAPQAQRVPAPALAFRADAPPPSPWPQDPANELYREGREALNEEDYAAAARAFQRLRQRHPRSRYVADALYWEAFARYRLGGSEELRYALGALETQARDYPRASTRRDAGELAARIRGELARRGDAGAAERVTENARRAGQSQSCGDDDDMRGAALNALLQMDAEQALPILRRVLARRDCPKLRAQAVFLVSQHRTPETENILLGVARNDPDPEVREQAVFWLSQVGSPRAVEILEDILRSGDDALKDKAIFALSQVNSPRAAQILREFAERENAPREVREQAIFWLGQRRSETNADYLRSLFGRVRGDELKEKVIFSLSQMNGFGNDRFILGIASDASQSMHVRKQALFWAGQMQGVSVAEIAGLYDRTRDGEMKEQIIFVLSQRGRDRAAIDKLIEIARRDPDREMRKKAIFWLSQSRDPRATEVISDIIDQ